MKKLKHTFELMTASYPELSSFICFSRAVKIANPNNRTLFRGFKELVDKSDYSKKDINDLKKYLVKK